MSREIDLKEAFYVSLPTVVPKIPEEEPEQFSSLTIKPIENHQSNESNQNVNMTPTIHSLSTI